MRKRIICAVAIIVSMLCLCACNNNPETEGVDVDTEPYKPAILSEINGNNISVKVPENLLDENGPIAKGERIYQKSDDDSTEVTIAGDGEANEDFDTYIWTIQINNESAGSEFEYVFSNMENRKIVKSEDVPGSEFDGGICIVDKEGDYIAEEISEPLAHDANGNPVKSYYRIEGNSLIQGLELTKDTVYPVTIE